MNTIGEKIRLERLKNNYSQEYMAFMLNISQPAYSKLERNETDISLSRVYEIAEIFKINAFVLMPKPKYGKGINTDFIAGTLRKLGKFWSADVRKKISSAYTNFQN